MHIPLDRNIENLPDVPYTISFVIRKRQQVDNLNELGKDKRPDEELIWDGTSEELDAFLDRVLSGKEQKEVDLVIDSIED